MRKPARPEAATTHPLTSLPSYLHVSDIQGLAQLATQATLGVADLAEKVQGNVYKAVAAPFGVVGQAFVDREAGHSGVKKMGITGLVYGSVKGVTRLAGGAVNALLSRAVPLVGEQASSPQREAMLSALNGVLGDQLLETANPLLIRMSLRHEGQALPLEKAALAQRLPGATAKLLVLVHGLCMNDLQWRSESAAGPHDHGQQLAHALGYTPLYLHYNTGLHISANGRQLAGLLEQLLRAWPQPVQELTLLAHSMGGLVARYYLRYGTDDVLDGNDFPVTQAGASKVRTAVLLGTPNLGSVKSLHAFLIGTRVGLSTIAPEVLATMPSIYQLFPHPVGNSLIGADGKELV
ncbi:MAG: esterase/lipase family protein, partial [Lysobacterales bacterium]